MTNSPKFSIVITAWKREEQTEKCIASSLAQDYKNFDVIVINNGSDFNKKQFSQDEKFIHFENDENLGCSHAFNQGMEYAFGNSSEYILFLNNDILIGKDVLNGFASFIKNKDKIGTVGILLKEGDLYSVGGYIDKKNKQYHRLLLEHKPDESEIPTPDILAPSASALFISKEAYEKAGKFDENFFAYWEDVDFYYRVLKNNLKNYLMTDYVATHVVNNFENLKSQSKYFYFYMVRNHYFYLQNVWGGKIPLRYLLWWYATIFNLYHKERMRNNISFCETIIDAHYCALNGIYGAYIENSENQRSTKSNKILFHFLKSFFIFHDMENNMQPKK